ncbi:MAG: putative toxin-antitoxin system toxin component, PIN family [Nanoarchaeota archaeon]
MSASTFPNSEARKLLIFLIDINAKIIVSPEILAEFETVLRRDFHFEHHQVEYLIKPFLSLSEMVFPVISKIKVCDDPDDDKIIETSIEGKAKFIITYDKHLLQLREFRGIRILTPKEFLSDG